MTELGPLLVGLLVIVAGGGAATFAVLKLIKGDLADGRRELRDMTELLRRGIEDQLSRVQKGTEDQLGRVQQTTADYLGRIQTDTNLKLEEMRQTVSEKLEGTLERRFTESFRMIGDRLEMVHKGLGEMQTLAIGVGDLKKVMTNVKTRGIWGEIQLGNLLEQVLSPEQYGVNIQTKKEHNGRVEFAIKLPGKGDADREFVWLPVDAKFPLENYHRLVDCHDRGDHAAAELEIKSLEVFIKASAKDISQKYVSPPDTTDFAFMYLPTEGLYAEVTRRPGLIETLQREYRVTVTGPANFAATLNALQMGFRTLAIQKRSSEVWEILGAAKTEFAKFDDILVKVQKKIQEAGNVIDDAQRRGRVIAKKLKTVEELPDGMLPRSFGATGSIMRPEHDDDAL